MLTHHGNHGRWTGVVYSSVGHLPPQWSAALHQIKPKLLIITPSLSLTLHAAGCSYMASPMHNSSIKLWLMSSSMHRLDTLWLYKKKSCCAYHQPASYLSLSLKLLSFCHCVPHGWVLYVRRWPTTAPLIFHFCLSFLKSCKLGAYLLLTGLLPCAQPGVHAALCGRAYHIDARNLNYAKTVCNGGVTLGTCLSSSIGFQYYLQVVPC